MNTENLHMFICAAECRSFTKAAKQLYISPSSLSTKIADLEKELGILLFERTTRSVALTPAGEYFLAEAKGISKRISEVTLRTREIASGSIGTLNVGYLDTIGFDIIQKVMMEYHSQFPMVELSMTKKDYPSLVKSIGDAEVDVAFMVMNAEEFPPGIVSEPLIASRLKVLMRNDHPFAGRNSVKLSELKDEKLLVVEKRSATSINNAIAMMFAKQGLTPNIVKECVAPEDVAMSVSYGMGIGIVSDFMSPCLSRFSGLCMVPLNHIMERCVLLLLRHVDNPNTCIEEMYRVAHAAVPKICAESVSYSLP